MRERKKKKRKKKKRKEKKTSSGVDSDKLEKYAIYPSPTTSHFFLNLRSKFLVVEIKGRKPNLSLNALRPPACFLISPSFGFLPYPGRNEFLLFIYLFIQFNYLKMNFFFVLLTSHLHSKKLHNTSLGSIGKVI